MTDHTPTPWHTGSTEHTDLVMGFKDNSECVLAELDTDDVPMAESEANAAFICAAVNNHEALLEMLKDASLQIEYLQEKLPSPTSTGVAVLARINHLLASVGAKRD